MEEFDQLLESLGAEDSSEPSMLSDLLGVFIDDTEEREHMWGLLHYVEAFPNEVYVPRLIAALPSMRSRAREWGELLLLRILNDSTCHALVRAGYSTLPAEQRSSLDTFLAEVAARSADLAGKAAAVSS